MNLCQYKDALGVPNKGFHEARLFGMARNDIIATIVAGIIIALIFNFNPIITTLALFLLGELLHVLFCVDTSFLKLFKN